MQLAALVLPMLSLAQPANPAADAPSDGSKRFNQEEISRGRAQFDRTCAPCHGRNMVNSGTTVYDLRKFPVDDDGRFRNSVAQGKGNMPSFKEALSADQISILWAYVGSRGGKEP